MADAFICDAQRTPIGRYGGALSGVRTDDLAAAPIAALMARNESVDWARIDDVVMGCANQAGEDNRNVARMAALLAGLPVDVPGITVNRLCASGLDAVGAAARAIRAGDMDLAIAGGVESMSRAPFVMPKSETAFGRANAVYDTTIGWRFINRRMKEEYGVEFDARDRRQRGRGSWREPRRSGRLRVTLPGTLGRRRTRQVSSQKRSHPSPSPSARVIQRSSTEMSTPAPTRTRQHLPSCAASTARTRP